MSNAKLEKEEVTSGDIVEIRKELKEIKNDLQELKQTVNSIHELLLSLNKVVNQKITPTSSPLITSSSSYRVNSRRNSGETAENQRPNSLDSTKEREKSSREFAREEIEENFQKITQDDIKEVALSGFEKLVRVSKGVPLISPVAILLEELIGVFKAFRCNRQAADEFLERIQYFSLILSELAPVAEKTSSNSFSICLSSFIEELKKAKQYFQKFSKIGFLTTLLKGNEPQEKFNQFDEKISTRLQEMATILHLENHQLLTSLTSTQQHHSYHVICNLESNFQIDIQQLMNDRTLQEKLAHLLYCPVTELQQEIKEYLTKTYANTEKILLFLEDGIHCQLHVLALRQFWKSFISPNSEVRVEMFVKHVQSFLLQYEKESKETAEQLSHTLKEALISLQKATNSGSGGNSDRNDGLGLETRQGWIDVYKLKQWTLSLPEDASFHEVIETLIQWKNEELINQPINLIPTASAILKYFSFEQQQSSNRQQLDTVSSKPFQLSNIIVWGNELEKKLTKRLQLSIGVTLIHGPVNVGKTFRVWKLIQNLTENNDSKESLHILWINCQDISQKKSFLANLNKQFNLLCEDYETILPTLENKINFLLESHSVILICDHVNPDVSNSILTFLSKLQCNLIFISRSTNASPTTSTSGTTSSLPPLPPASPQNKLQSVVSSAGGQSIYLDALSELEAVELATQLGKSEKSSAKLLANAAKRLPGYMVSYMELNDAQLVTVAGRMSSTSNSSTGSNGTALATFFSKLTHSVSVGSKSLIGNTSSQHSAGSGGSSHHQSNSNVYNEGSIVLTPLERFIFDCLCPVLSNGLHFQKKLSWELCKDYIEDQSHNLNQQADENQQSSVDLFTWNRAFESLLRKGVILNQGNNFYSLITSPASADLPIIFAPPSAADNEASQRKYYPIIDEKDQWKCYYLYWCRELKRINELLEGQEQKQGLMLFDEHQQHFDFLLKTVKEMSLLDPSSTLEIVTHLAPNLIRIGNLRLPLQDSMQLYKLFVHVFQSTNNNNNREKALTNTNNNNGNNSSTIENITIEPLNCEKNSWKFKDSQTQNAYLMAICGYSIFLYTSMDIHNAESFINSAMKGIEWLEQRNESGKTTEFFFNKITICTTKGLILLASKRLKESIEIFTFTLQLLSSNTNLVMNDKSILPKRIRLQLNLASAYRANHQLEKALDLYEECMIAGKDLIGEENSDLAIVYRSIADIYSQQIQKELKTLDSKSSSQSIGQTTVATLKNSIEKVIFLYETSLRIAFHTFGEIHHNTGLIYYSYGMFLFHLTASTVVSSSPLLTPVVGEGDTERIDQSLSYLEKSEKVWKLVHGNHYSMLAACYYSFSLIYEKKGDLVRAVYYLEQAIAIKRVSSSSSSSIATGNDSHSLSSVSLLATNDPSRLSDELALYTYKLGTLYEKQSNLPQALKLYEESLAIRRALHHNQTSLEYTNALWGYGRLLVKIHPVLNNFSSSNQLGTGSNGSSSASSPIAGENHGNSGRVNPEIFQKMIEIFKELLPLQRKYYGENHQSVITSLTNLGNLSLKLDFVKEATSYLEEAAVLIQSQLNSSNALTASVSNSLHYQLKNIQNTLENIQSLETPPTSPSLSLPMASPLSTPPPGARPTSISSTTSSYFSSSKK